MGRCKVKRLLGIALLAVMTIVSLAAQARDLKPQEQVIVHPGMTEEQVLQAIGKPLSSVTFH